MSKHAFLPLTAIALAAAACATVAVLQVRSSNAHEAQVALVRVENQFSQLQGLPWNVQNPRAGAPAEIKAQMRGFETRIVSSLRRLSPATFADVRNPLLQNFAALDRIYAIGLRAKGWTAIGPTNAVSQLEGVTVGAVIGVLERAGERYDRSARWAQWEAVGGGIAAIVLLLGAFLFFHRRSVRTATAREAMLAELCAAQEDRRKLLARTVEVAEHERIRLAIDLHDGPIQQLTALAFNLDLLGRRIERGDVEKLNASVAKVRESLAHEMDSLRRLMVELRPPVLDERGIAAALEDACADVLEGTEVRWNVLCDVGGRRLAPELETVIYRVVREALVNTRKHAAAANVEVAVRVDDDQRLRVDVRDDGRGFDVPAVARAGDDGSRYGLIGMDERVKGMNGQLQIVSHAGCGTQVVARLPIKERTDKKEEVTRRERVAA